MIIRKAAYNLFPDEQKNILYVTGGKVYAICLKTGKELFSFPSVSNPNQVIWDEDRKLLIVKSTVGQFAVFNYGNYNNIVHKFKLRKVHNTDYDFVLYKNKLYGIATSSEGLKLFIINLETLKYKEYLTDNFHFSIKDKPEGYIPYNLIGIYKEFMVLGKKNIDRKLPVHVYLANIDEDDKVVIKDSLAKELIDCGIFPKPDNVFKRSNKCYYETEKFEFLATWDYLEITPKNVEDMIDETENNLPTDYETYIRENGITKEIIKNYGDEEILHGGYFWAIDRLEEKERQGNEIAKEFLSYNGVGTGLPMDEFLLFVIGLFQMEYLNGGYSQYFQNKGNTVMIDCLLYALKTIGAVETLAYVEKCDKLEAISNFEEIDELSGDLTEDYVGKTINYLKQLLIK